MASKDVLYKKTGRDYYEYEKYVPKYSGRWSYIQRKAKLDESDNVSDLLTQYNLKQIENSTERKLRLPQELKPQSRVALELFGPEKPVVVTSNVYQHQYAPYYFDMMGNIRFRR